MSTNRLLPVVIPQTYSFSLVSPYGNPYPYNDPGSLISRLMFLGLCYLIPEEAFKDGVTYKSIAKDLGLA